MSIQFQTKKGEAISITFEYQTAFHSSVYWLTIDKLYFGDTHEIEFAKSLLMWFKNSKY